MENFKNTIASDLLKIKAVTLAPKQPFTWASGIEAPIYTDNRKTIGYPEIRTQIAEGLCKIIKQNYPEANVIGGVATAGIPHAAIVADKLNLPMIYVRSKPKNHGAGKQIEGDLPENPKVVLIDDLISTGGSVLKAVEAVRKENVNVVGVAAIFTYQLKDSDINFKAAKTKLHTLTNYSEMIEQAHKENIVNDNDLHLLKKWRDNPWKWNK
ncbi:orotate phosphoribosyltransferase [Apilactobacillus xinyiensis]|uniref:orotate phosphoribosyltransferase n=1 Tax=Apilactobacillus xinyiensis TaxID=2841032 RepID=UPI001C7DE252|nr:orotate phosphoribosyltransferase [Apilactobacillus xinyiensis]MCL0318529.1 orotate phosphoribosyltransferase [Apilactobacillus xinyiensis]